MKILPVLLFLSTLSACVPFETKLRDESWVYYERWDQNADLKIDRNEFRAGYLDSHFFKRWSKKSDAISLSAFCDSVFKSVDVTSDNRLDSVELHSKTAYYMIGDSVAHEQLAKDEFRQNICNSDIAGRFDKASDQQISAEEMAIAMFDVCDTNKDGNISSLEFYLWEVYRR